MPAINFRTNIPLEKFGDLKEHGTRVTKMISDISGEPINKIAMTLEPGMHAMWAGSTEPCAQVLITVTTMPSEDNVKKYFEVITEKIHEVHGIAKDRIVIEMKLADLQNTAVGGVLLKDL